MPIPGRRSAIGSIRRIERHINRIDDLAIPKSYRMMLRIAAGVLPALLGSLFAFWLTPIFILAALLSLYLAARPIQEELFNLSANEKYWHISVPFNLLFIAWAFALALMGNGLQISHSVGPMVIAAAAAIWPVYMGRKAYGRKCRKVPFNTAYAVVSVLVLFQQLIIIGGKLS